MDFDFYRGEVYRECPKGRVSEPREKPKDAQKPKKKWT